MLKTLNQLKIGDCYRHQYASDDHCWRIVIGFSKSGNPRSRWISPRFDGMIHVEVQRGSRRYEVDNSIPTNPKRNPALWPTI